MTDESRTYEFFEVDETTREEAAIRTLLEDIDPKPDREGLRDTPKRVLKAWEHWTSGNHIDPDALLKTFEDGSEKYDELVFVGAIPFYSTCEHHLAPFFGVAHVGYIPNGHIVGLSKIPRLIDAFARRLSVQERITTQVAETIERVLTPQGVAVVLQARHMCMESRGVNKPGAVTTTAAMRGAFKDKPHAKAEFYQMIANAKGVGLA
jgi:GTP cyclohydrolase I